MATRGTPASTAESSPRIPAGAVPRASDRTEASSMVGPSMAGSEKGMPTSTASAPASATARRTSVHRSSSPPVT
jgi:hypothetical protein